MIQIQEQRYIILTEIEEIKEMFNNLQSLSDQQKEQTFNKIDKNIQELEQNIQYFEKLLNNSQFKQQFDQEVDDFDIQQMDFENQLNQAKKNYFNIRFESQSKDKPQFEQKNKNSINQFQQQKQEGQQLIKQGNDKMQNVFQEFHHIHQKLDQIDEEILNQRQKLLRIDAHIDNSQNAILRTQQAAKKFAMILGRDKTIKCLISLIFIIIIFILISAFMAKIKKKQSKQKYVFNTDQTTNDCTETFKYLTIHNQKFLEIISDENLMNLANLDFDQKKGVLSLQNMQKFKQAVSKKKHFKYQCLNKYVKKMFGN